MHTGFQGLEKCSLNLSSGFYGGFSGGAAVKNLPADEGDAGDVSSIPGLGRSPGGRNSNPLQYSCLDSPMDRGTWWATVHGIQELDTSEHSIGFPGGSLSKESACNVGDQVQSLGREDPPEKEMATHSSILAWRIPWTEEPGGLQTVGSQRVGHD